MQTRFSHNDIDDLKKKFEKYSTWVLVDGSGKNIKDEDCNDPDEGIIPMFKDSDEQEGDKSKKFGTSQPQPKKSDLTGIRKMVATKYKKVKINIDGIKTDDDLCNHYTQKMSIQQFRGCMGLLGLESNAFLSDRIFEVVDTDGDEYITFEQFATIMDTLINGDEDEKQEFSFSLIEGNIDRGYFSFDEFSSFMMKVIAYWCTMTGSQLKVDKEGFRDIFERLGPRDGLVELEQYKAALKENPQFFDWFDLLNQGSNDGKKAKNDMNNLKLNVATNFMAISKRLDALMNKVQILDQSAIDQASHYESSYSHRDDSRHNYDTKKFQEQFHYQEPVKRNIISLLPTPQKEFQSVKTQQSYPTNQSRLSQPSSINKQYLELKYLLNPDPALVPPSPKMEDVMFMDKHIKNQFASQMRSTSHFEQSSCENDDDGTCSDIGTEENGVKSHYQQIMEIKKQKDIQRDRKREYGEKRAQIQQFEKRPTNCNESDNEMIDDPESEEEEEGKEMMPLSNNNMHYTQYDESYSPASMMKANSTGFQMMRNQQEISTQSRLGSFKSVRSGLRNNNQQSSHGGQQKSSQNQRRGGGLPIRGSGVNNNIRNRRDSSFDRETSPVMTNDGSRSDAQGGGPRFSKKRTVSDNGDIRHQFQSTLKQSQDQQHLNELNYSPYKSELRMQNQEIKEEIGELQKLTFAMLAQFTDSNKDQDLKAQLQEIMQATESKESHQEESKELTQSSPEGGEYDLNGLMKPTNEMEEFFKTRNRKVLGQSSGKDKKRLSSGKKSKSVHKTLSKKASNKAFIHIGHDNWNLVLHMMLGVRQSVRNVMHEEVFELIEEDFNRKYCYELIGKKTKSMKVRVFEFYDFSPRVFHRIRSMYNITPDEYLKSIGPENLIGGLMLGNISSLKEQCSTGKSGSFFYYTADNRFMLKTISNAEFKHLKLILKDYYEHLTMYPHTLITRFFGLHKIRCKDGGISGTQRIYFVIMANVFNTSREINVRFDLKGSTHGRNTKKTPDEYVDSAVALKDLDLIEQELKINVDPVIREALISQIKADVKMFQKLNINDYSLLMGVHYINDEEDADSLLKQSPDIIKLIESSFSASDNQKMSIIKNSYPENIRPSLCQERPAMPFFECHDGGILARDKRCIYFVGIIDTLTMFGGKKKLEYLLKNAFWGKKISCIPPDQYGERFFKFMSSIFDTSQNGGKPSTSPRPSSTVSRFRP